MAAQAEALYRLQQIDLQLIQHRKRLKEIAAALQDNEVVMVAQAEVTAAQRALSPLKTKVRDLELEIQSNAQKTRTSEDRLYGGTVKNPKELQDLQNEIEALKRRKEVLEDRLLETMIQVEEAEAELAGCESNLQSVTAEWEQQHRDLLAEKATLEGEVESLKQDRDAALQGVTPENQQVYESMRKEKANQPVAVLQGNACSVCGIELTTARIQEVRHAQELVKCQNCGRILVVSGP